MHLMNFENEQAKAKAEGIAEKYGNFRIYEDVITLKRLEDFEKSVLKLLDDNGALTERHFASKLAESKYNKLAKKYKNPELLRCANPNYKYTLREVLELEDYLIENRGF